MSMEHDEMREKVSEKLRTVIEYVWDSARCSFYREHWTQHGIKAKPILKTPEDIEKLPFVSKQDFEHYPNLSDRLYVQRTDVTCLTSTSGSTSGTAFFKWRHGYACNYYQILKEAGVKRLLYLWNYHRATPLVTTCIQRQGIEAIYVDPHQLSEVERMLSSIPVDAITATPSLLTMVQQHVRDQSLLSSIRFIDMLGEIPSMITKQLLKEAFPNARMYQHFAFQEASSESLFLTPECDNDTAFHVHEDNVFVEIVDSQLTFSTLFLPHDMPLIRYQTGDSAKWYAGHSCSCGRPAPRVVLTGRYGVDYVRVRGFEVRIDCIERVLKNFYDDIEPIMHAEVSEQRHGNTIIAHLHLHLVRKKSSGMQSLYLRDQIIAALHNVRLSPQVNLGIAVRNNFFDAPTLTLHASPLSTEKSKTIRVSDS